MGLAEPGLFDEPEPECGDRGEHGALAGDGRGHDDVESGDAIGRDDEESRSVVSTWGKVVDIADLATAEPGEIQAGFQERSGVGGGVIRHGDGA